jgi:hypothetical protein
MLAGYVRAKTTQPPELRVGEARDRYLAENGFDVAGYTAPTFRIRVLGVTFVQRFSATLQSFVHLHVVAIDGVFTRETKGGPAVFHEGRAPSTSDVAAVAGRVEKRVRRWLRRRGLLDERAAEERSNEAPVLSPMEACLQASLFAGELARVRESTPEQEEQDADEARFRVQSKSPWSAGVGGRQVRHGRDLAGADPSAHALHCATERH